MKNVLAKLYSKFVSGKQKAIVALVSPVVVGLVAHFVSLDKSTVAKVVEFAVSGVLTCAGVYLKANK